MAGHAEPIGSLFGNRERGIGSDDDRLGRRHLRQTSEPSNIAFACCSAPARTQTRRQSPNGRADEDREDHPREDIRNAGDRILHANLMVPIFCTTQDWKRQLIGQMAS
ncbi:MAG: hypothetical protein ACTHMG_15805 [Sphingomonas sp.]